MLPGEEDARLLRLADLSIEIRMLKARAQAALDGQAGGGSDAPRQDAAAAPPAALAVARCPYCGHRAGLALLPRECGRLSTPVRCFSCLRDAVAFEWVDATPAGGLRAASTRHSGEVIPAAVSQTSRRSPRTTPGSR